MKNSYAIIGLIILLATAWFAVKKYHLLKNFKTQQSTNQSESSNNTYAQPSPTNQGQTTDTNQTSNPEPQTSNIFLEITSPKDDEDLSSTTVTVSGKTIPLADVSVNEKDTKADSTGNFSIAVTLEDGDDINVIANDKDGNYAEKTIAVNLP